MKKQHSLPITPKTRVGELLDTYPELEPVLMALAPAFKKLQNPVLRKTVGKVATLQQAATLGKLPLSELINTLRSSVGQVLSEETEVPLEMNQEVPDWFDKEKVSVRFDATPLINAGENPMPEILKALEKTPREEIFQLSAPFIPAPIIELIGRKGYSYYCKESGNDTFHTFFLLENNNA